MKPRILAASLAGAAAIASLALLAQAQVASRTAPKGMDMEEPAATTYEHLATAIIELNKTEDNLVKGILIHHSIKAQHHLHQAEAAEGDARRAHLEHAAAEITDVANEGDKRVQSIRQRLSKAGHTHNTDTQTKEDYMFIDSKEKKALLALAGRVAQLGAKASAADIHAAEEELAKSFEKAIAED